MAIFNSFLYVYQRVSQIHSKSHPLHLMANGLNFPLANGLNGAAMARR